MCRMLMVASACLAMSLMVNQASAQSPVLAEMYGRGVHRYFAGDYDSAYRLLSMAIDNGSQDPRTYYFRGLVAWNTGRPEEAREDWQTGAQLESQGEYGLVIGRSLARIQGSERLELEEIRQMARLKAQEMAQARAQARYQQTQDAEQQVLRQPGTGVVPPAPPAAAPTVVPDANPFAGDEAAAAGEPEVQAEQAFSDPLQENATAAPGAAPAPQAQPSGDPFNTSPGGDPFPASPADANPFDTGGADPFESGLGGDAGANPFGGSDLGGAAGDAQSDPFADDAFPNP